VTVIAIVVALLTLAAMASTIRDVRRTRASNREAAFHAARAKAANDATEKLLAQWRTLRGAQGQ